MISSVQDYPVSHYFNPDAAQRFFIPKYQREYVWNLTLSGYNSKLGIMEFMKKRDRKNDQGDFIGYRNALYLNAGLAIRDDWNEAAIAARTDKMLQEVKSILSLREDK